ncbi:MAG: fumarate hydratase [Euryarchaeota archaeon]|nr:fumarate hydratase [Euryarchaeota archaeon]
MAIKPEKLLNKSLNKKVRIVLRNGMEYRGILRGFDEFMNLTLEGVRLLGPEGEGEDGQDIGSLMIKGYDTMLIIPERRAEFFILSRTILATMRTVELQRVSDSIKEMAVEACHDARGDLLEALKGALEDEDSPLGRDILEKLLENAEIAASERIPYCQDTGTAVVFVELGEEVAFDRPGLVEAINEGVRQGYQEGYLRKSMAADPLRRGNTGDNTPAAVHIEVVPGDRLKILFAAKGSGSENMSALRMLPPSAGWEGVKEFVLETVEKAGPNPCPPGVLGVGLGGNFETCAILAKKALYRGIGRRNPDPFYAGKELELLEAVNGLGIGPQGMGGRTTVLDIHIEARPCHIGSLPVAVNMDCHAHRFREVEL